MKTTGIAIEQQSNIPKERVIEGRLNTAKLGLFMKNLISNYNNPHLATLREWVSNAHDSHVEAGVKKPIKVSIPTGLSRLLVVEDFGTGMSFEDVADVYSVVLSSTKDEDNNGIGGFGIGGKSALAVADQYTLETVKDGLKNVFIFERSDVGGFKANPVVENMPTDQPSGAKFSVAADPRYFHGYDAVLGGWKPEEIQLTEGEFMSLHRDVINFKHGFVKKSILEDAYGNRSNSSNRLTVLVGPVAYSLPSNFNWELSMESAIRQFPGMFTLQLAIGEVTFPSSREVIEQTDANVAVINKRLKKLEKEFLNYLKEFTSAFESLEVAYKFSRSNFARTINADVHYDGRKINEIRYKGIVGYSVVYQSGPLEYKLSALTAEEFEKIDPARIAVVVKVGDTEEKVTAETYRKHVRKVVKKEKEFFNIPRYYSRSRYGYGGYSTNERDIILITPETDPLHEITSKIYDYEALRKETPKQPRGVTFAEKTAEERKAFVEEIPVSICTVAAGSRSKTLLFGKHPAYAAGNPIIGLQSEMEPSQIPILDAVFGIGDRVVVMSNKDQAKRTKVHLPQAETLADFLAALSPKQKKAAQKKFHEIRIFQEQFAFGSYNLEAIKEITSMDELLPEVKEFFSLPLIAAAANLPHLNSPGWGVKKGILIRNFFEIEDNFSSGRPKAPFTLLNFDRGTAMIDLVDYLNWKVPPFISSKSSVK